MACSKPCRECPYRKNSAPGYFGGHSPSEYRGFISQDTIVACHLRSKFDDDGLLIESSMKPCTGHILAQVKSCKLPSLNKDLIEFHRQMRERPDFEELKANSLSIFDFNKHHGIED